jgi:hypothetical protein
VIVTQSCLATALGCTRQEATRTSTTVDGGKVLAVGDLTWPDIDALDLIADSLRHSLPGWTVGLMPACSVPIRPFRPKARR